MPNNSFERFYYEKVALGEGCGCAEQIITSYELERHAREAAVAMPNTSHKRSGERLTWLARLFRRQGPQQKSTAPGKRK